MVYNITNTIFMLQTYRNKLSILNDINYEDKLILYNETLYLDRYYSSLDLASFKLKYKSDVTDFIELMFYCYLDYIVLLQSELNKNAAADDSDSADDSDVIRNYIRNIYLYHISYIKTIIPGIKISVNNSCFTRIMKEYETVVKIK